MIRHFSILLLIPFLIGCAPQSANVSQPSSNSQATAELKAFHTLANFFRLLNEKAYADAAPLYGGDYEQLQSWNPDIDPSSHAALWQRACKQNGLQCLKVRSATLNDQEGDMYVFQVEFRNPDGSLFVLGPCCGADETEMPPVSQFEYIVTRTTDGKFVVMNPPPYVP